MIQEQAIKIKRGFVDRSWGQVHYRTAGNGPALVLTHKTLFFQAKELIPIAIFANNPTNFSTSSDIVIGNFISKDVPIQGSNLHQVKPTTLKANISPLMPDSTLFSMEICFVAAILWKIFQKLSCRLKI